VLRTDVKAEIQLMQCLRLRAAGVEGSPPSTRGEGAVGTKSLVSGGGVDDDTRRRALADMETAILRDLGPPIAVGKHRPDTYRQAKRDISK